MALRTRKLAAGNWRIGLLALGIAGAVGSARAQFVWAGGGGDDNVTTLANWVDLAVPVSGVAAEVEFAGSARTAPNFDVNLLLTGLTFAAGASSFTLGGNDIVLAADGTVTNNSSALQTIGNNVLVGGGTTWNAAAGDLKVTGNISDLSIPEVEIHGQITKIGTGTLTLTGTNTYSGWTLVNQGTLLVDIGGSISSAVGAIHVGENADDDGTLTVTGPPPEVPSVAASLSPGSISTAVDGDLSVGVFGKGTLNLENGGTANTAVLYVGTQEGSTGIVNIDGTGSQLNSNYNSTAEFGGDVVVGNYGNGTLNVTNGGAVFNDAAGSLGLSSDSMGKVKVTGLGSSWQAGGDITVGYAGTGELDVLSGGVVTNDALGWVGLAATAKGTVKVDGAGSSWAIGSDLIVGQEGYGELDITSGGLVSNAIGYIGSWTTDAVGVITVDGVGSLWQNKDGTYTTVVGYSGTGTLNVTNGGKVEVDGGNQGLELGIDEGSHGTINIGQGGGAGILNVSEVLGSGGGTATLNFNHTDANYYFTKDGTSGGAPVLITGNTAVNQLGSGTTTFEGENTYSGATTVSDGALRVDGSIDSVTTVESGGRLTGTGTFNASVLIKSGGGLFPGATGTATFTNGLAFEGGAVMDYGLGSESDLVVVNGGLLAGPATGTVTLNFHDTGDFTAGVYTLFDFTGAEAVDFTTDKFDFGNTIPGYDYSLFFDTTKLELNAIAVPEPSVLALLAAGLAGIGLAKWRRPEVTRSQARWRC